MYPSALLLKYVLVALTIDIARGGNALQGKDLIEHPSAAFRPSSLVCPVERFLAGHCWNYQRDDMFGASSGGCSGHIDKCKMAGDLSRHHIRVSHALLGSSAENKTKVLNDTTLELGDGSKFTVTKKLKLDCFEDEAGDRRCLPGLVYIGFGHAGSTSLFAALHAHPQLEPHLRVHPGLRGFETWFFDKLWTEEHDKNTHQARADYAALFPTLPTSRQIMTFEKGPWYWQNLSAPERMFRTIPNAKLLMLLRDPVTWLHSQFYSIKTTAPILALEGHAKPFDPLARTYHAQEQIDVADEQFVRSFMTIGMQLCQRIPIAISNFLKYYPRTALIVQLTEVFKERPVEVLRKIESEVGLEPHDWDSERLKFKDGHQYHVSHRPPVSPRIRKMIRKGCQPYIQEVEKMLSMQIEGVWDQMYAQNVEDRPQIKRYNPRTRKLEWMHIDSTMV